ncbi:MAG: HU family DNA-binding protein [Bacteroidales bacterium]|nr:HU family DNA-binding protein [Bacteroidales bacterium]MBP5396879.1 HU family DNA-binding protein [Bacteroidales bacterium]MBP5612542.1 HU family DNA-binding protein [Bacteroidales bacterium]
MNKAELISAMAEKAGLTNAQARKALDAMVDATVETLKKSEKLVLIGFGTFSVTDKPAHKARNPQNGKEIMVKAKKVVKFKAGSSLKM